MKVSPSSITELKDNEIFVFGSNADGKHFGGAAKLAHEKFGAVWGVGYGSTGQCYAIDSMEGLTKIENQVRHFEEYATNNPDKNFLVTDIGCGIAGHLPEQIAPLFARCMDIETSIYLKDS